MRRIAAASLLHFFNGGKSESLLGRDAVPNPHVTFERTKVTKTLSEGFRSPRRNKLRYAQYNHRLNCCTLRYCSLIEKNPEIFFEEEKQRKAHELSF